MVYFYDRFYPLASSQLVTVYFCFVENAVIIYSPSCHFKPIWLAYIQWNTKGDALQKFQTALFHTTKPYSAKKEEKVFFIWLHSLKKKEKKVSLLASVVL